jgi:hypothetical protein
MALNLVVKMKKARTTRNNHLKKLLVRIKFRRIVASVVDKMTKSIVKL